MSSDGACVAQSGNTGHNSVWAMYVLIYIYISAVLGGTLLCQILGLEHSVSSGAESEETLVTMLIYSLPKQLRL